jgi:hypothetical protein
MFSTKRHWNPARAFGSRPKVQIWSPLIVESDYFPIDHRVLGQIAERLDDIRILSFERFSVSGNTAQLSFELIATARYPSSLISYVVMKFMWRNT